MSGIEYVDMHPLGDAALEIEFGSIMDERTTANINRFVRDLDVHPFVGFREYTSALTTVTVFYNPLLRSFSEVQAIVRAMLASPDEALQSTSRLIRIPVCYGGEYGPDLPFVAEHNHLRPEEVIAVHSGITYDVQMIGFAPGFPYLSGMSPRIAAPRRETPRMAIPSGSVGIAGLQTGIYSIETPGGWQVIGRTPASLFRPLADPPCLLQAGDKLQFVPITVSEYHNYHYRM